MKELLYCFQWGFLVKEKDGLFIKYEDNKSWYSSIFLKGGRLILKYD